MLEQHRRPSAGLQPPRHQRFALDCCGVRAAKGMCLSPGLTPGRHRGNSLTLAEVGGEPWSWCESKMQRLRHYPIADAAVDGVVPEGHLRTPAQAYHDVMEWLKRLDTGETHVITRPKIVVPLPDTDPTDVGRRQRRYGGLPKMNHSWNTRRSETT